MHKAKGPNPIATLNKVRVCVPIIPAFPRWELENQKFKVICSYSSRSCRKECYAVLTFGGILETVVLSSLEDNDIV